METLLGFILVHVGIFEIERWIEQQHLQTSKWRLYV
jgi:hypothetical protein